MKIGFSFGRCIRDIVNGLVDEDDVFLIISKTFITDSSEIADIITEYGYREDYLLGCDLDKATEIGERLYLDRKIYQPRMFRKQFGRNYIPEDFVWMDLTPTVVSDELIDTQVEQAWKNYILALKLSSSKKIPNKDDF